MQWDQEPGRPRARPRLRNQAIGSRTRTKGQFMEIPLSFFACAGTLSLPGQAKAPQRRRIPLLGGSSRSSRGRASVLGSAAGSEAPRRFGFCARGEHEVGVPWPFGGNPKRRRRCALPAHSTIWRHSERCEQTASDERQRPGMRRCSTAFDGSAYSEFLRFMESPSFVFPNALGP
jgi:hypothetical protein